MFLVGSKVRERAWLCAHLALLLSCGVETGTSCSARALLLLTLCFRRVPAALALQQVTEMVYLPATLFVSVSFPQIQ